MITSSALAPTSISAHVVIRGVYVVYKGAFLYELFYYVFQGHTLLYGMAKVLLMSTLRGSVC